MTYDILIKNGDVINGLGTPRFKSDIAIDNDKIVAISSLDGAKAEMVIDATDMIVSPGFIDVHTHDDNLIFSDSSMRPKISQGVTSIIVGNCGVSLAPLILNQVSPPPPQDLLGEKDSYKYSNFSEYRSAIEKYPPATNVGFLAGHGTLRICAMESTEKPASPSEIKKMQILIDEAMSVGGLGISTGLIYEPNKAATIDEISAVTEVVANYGGIYTTHMRDESNQINKSIEETLLIGQRTNAPVIISHHKCMGKSNYGRSSETLRRINQAKSFQTVGLDAYPYTAASTVILPEMVEMSERVIITWSKTFPNFSGHDLEYICNQMKCKKEDSVKALMPGGAIYFLMNESDVQKILQHPDTMIGSDGLPNDKHPHPRLWGTFPRVLGHYARDIGIFTLEEAVRKMTSLSARTFKLKNRGELIPGSFADVVIFDPKTVKDNATYDNPLKPSEGIDTVIVNGTIVFENGIHSSSRPGVPLLRS
ncbi:MAG: D-aminoacylase [Rhodospirillaceae bacterium]|nr:D-aminoacylase [Rhodospirillaceae bacterium]